MTVSFVLRLVRSDPDHLAGELEHVETGERTIVRSADELLALLQRALIGETPDAELH